MVKERLNNGDIIINIFGDRKYFEEAVKKKWAEAKESGDPEIGSVRFIRAILESDANKISEKDFNLCKDEIMKVIDEIDIEKKASKKTERISKMEQQDLFPPSQLN